MNTHSLPRYKVIAALKARDEIAAVITRFMGEHVYVSGVVAQPGRSHYDAYVEGYIVMGGGFVKTHFHMDG